MIPPGSAEAWLLGVLRGDAAHGGAVWPATEDQWQQALTLARTEGVTGLVHRLVWGGAGSHAPNTAPKRWATAARQEAGVAMVMQAQCRRVSHALAEAGIAHLWLKGVALAQWLYHNSAMRGVGDMDLLLEDFAQVRRAEPVLHALGYRWRNPYPAGDLVVNELLAVSGTGHELDVHWALGNSPLYARRLTWEELWTRSQAIPALGESARGLSPVHALLHAAMHRAMNELVGAGTRLRWLYDIHLLAGGFSAQEWAQLTHLAAERGLAGTVRAALELARDRLGTPISDEVMTELSAAASREPLDCRRLNDWWYRQRTEWRALPTLAQRLRWARQLLIPDLAHLRARYGQDGAAAPVVVGRRLHDGVRRLRRYMER